MPPVDLPVYREVVNIIDTPWQDLNEEEKEILDTITVSAWDVIQANSGGHKCITNISGLNFFSRATRNPPGSYRKSEGKVTRYVEFVKWVQKQIVEKLKEKIEQSSINEIKYNIKNVLLESSFVADALGDLGAAAVGATGVVGMPVMLALIGKNVYEIKQNNTDLEIALDKFRTEPTSKELKVIENEMFTVTSDLLDLTSRIIQLAPDPTGISDFAAFVGEQGLERLALDEVPKILDKLKVLLDKVPIVGKTDVVKAMGNVGLSHDLLNKIGKELK